VPPGDPAALAQALASLAADRNEAERLGAAARARAEASYTPYAVVIPLLDQLSRRAMKGPR
jgi:glycosyltransferase involved in cell wall biosynthesis